MNKEKRLLELEPDYIPAKKSKKKMAWSVVYYVIGIFLSLLFISPLLYMFAASTKSEEAIAFSNGTIMMFIPDFTNLGGFFDNYKVIFGQYDVWKYALNSIVYAIIVIFFNVIVNGLAGYVLAKFNFPGKGFFNFIILFLIVVPVETSIIPLYSIVKQMLGLKGVFSILAVILPSVISVFNIFLFTQFFSSIPKEYEEAMHIDGSNRVRIFFDLILPLSKPIVATTMVFTFIGVWNDYVWPSMVLPNTGDEAWPLLPIQAALTSIQSIESITTGEIMASLVITSLPIFILYAAAQKYIVKGFGTAGLKM
ncbi:MAG: carbohydrate ABC transporter permease [Candidatus Enteromonas sp.]|nr:carbohydrate ABC transporter permease [Mollicutes bacterium]MDY3904783.1 carbohydrate ABC transporter permease [Candidatus Enteromonas sp.]MDY4936171.1 carbohydrate ABC transporter permease [Candidatus Enteromonas sp.]